VIEVILIGIGVTLLEIARPILASAVGVASAERGGNITKVKPLWRGVIKTASMKQSERRDSSIGDCYAVDGCSCRCGNAHRRAYWSSELSGNQNGWRHLAECANRLIPIARAIR